MSIPLTTNVRNASHQNTIEPALVLEVDGVGVIYGIRSISQIIQIGESSLLIGGGWLIGGSSSVEDQASLISLEGTSTSINQQLNPDQAAVTSVSSVQVALVDKDDQITELISPGFIVDDLLARRAKLWLGFKGLVWPQDYIILFRGIIDDIVSEQGKVVLNIAHPDQKKRQQIFQKASTILNGACNNSQTSIPVESTDNFLDIFDGPGGSPDSSVSHYFRIDDEIIKYTTKLPGVFTGCVRGQLGTTAASHDDESNVDSFYRLTGNCIHLALKLMLSGWNDYFETGVPVTSFERISSTESVDNAIFFQDVDLEQAYGLTIGDYITTVDATNGANNVTLKTISDIVQTTDGSYCVVDGVTFVYEADSPATISFRSQYDTLGEGLKMYPDEVDIAQHLRLYTLFLSSLEYDFYLKDTIEGKDFLNKEIYLPASMYAVPRKARASAQYHIGPIPGSSTLTLNNDNVMEPSRLKLRRTTSKNFYNTVVYRFDDDVLEDKFLSGAIYTDATSKTRIPYGNKTLVIDSKGMRSSLSANVQTEIQATRKLNRYKFAAEFLDDVKVNFSSGFAVEVGDIILLDGSRLNISDTRTGIRGMTVRFFEVVNKKFDMRKGEVSLNLVDTAFSTTNRYCLIGPSSQVKSGSSTSQFVIEPGPFSTAEFGAANEGQKWERYPGVKIKVRNADFSINEETYISNVSRNTITVSPALSFTPANGQVMELSNYNGQTEQCKALYGHMTDNATFADGLAAYRMI